MKIMGRIKMNLEICGIIRAIFDWFIIPFPISMDLFVEDIAAAGRNKPEM